MKRMARLRICKDISYAEITLHRILIVENGFIDETIFKGYLFTGYKANLLDLLPADDVDTEVHSHRCHKITMDFHSSPCVCKVQINPERVLDTESEASLDIKLS